MEIEKKYLEKPWLRSHELACAPETLEPYPEMTYTEAVLDEPAKKYPNELALVFLNYEMTFRELKEKVDRFATALSDLGVKKGDVVATVIPSSIQFSICDLAIPEIGAIHFPGNPIDSVDALVDKFKRTNCQTVICAHTNVKYRDIIDKIEEVKERTNLKNIILTKLEDFSSKVPEHEIEEGVIWLTDLLEKYPPNPPKVDIDPKVVSCTRLALGSMAPQSMIPLMDGLATTIIAAPICHLLGHEFYRYFLTLGLTVLLQSDPRDTKEFVRLAKKYHPVVTPAAATLYMNLAKEEGADNLGILGISGGMPLAPASQADMEKETRSMVAEAHGLSETSGATLAPTAVDIAAPLLGGNKETTGKLIRLLDTLLKTPGIVPLLRTKSCGEADWSSKPRHDRK
jgi:Acyl-CoA synthetases (AMP-forming)/AMP-acid ligases II